MTRSKEELAQDVAKASFGRASTSDVLTNAIAALTEHEAAIRAELELVWTTERPKVPGWYWLQNGLSQDPRILYLYLSDERLYALTSYGRSELPTGFSFAGPLPMPKEPTV